ncbi:hypothetical protein BDV06DRAFT_233822 [Aspergillus oleicola]
MSTATKVPIPFEEPPWITGPSLFYSASHRSWNQTCRSFIDKHLNQHAMEWETEESIPAHVYSQFAASNMLVPILPTPLPVAWLQKLGIRELPGGLAVEHFDAFHGAIFQDNMLRSGLMGPPGAITTGVAFGIPPIYNFGSPALQERFLPGLLTGKTRICIAITEPGAGSDVSNVATTAEKSLDGTLYIINGIKKWITNGIWSDYATMLVRTGGSGPQGLSLLLVPLKNQPGVTMRRLKVAGQISAGTSFIELDNVEVPIDNLIGQEGQGMKYAMTNFNHERLTIAVGVVRQARVALSSAFEYALKREAFGKPLMDQPVVRARLAKAGVRLETLWAYIEQLLFQTTCLPKEVADRELGGITALVKAHAGKVLSDCVNNAVLVFGGNGYTRTGQGELIEKLYREIPGAKIPGGSEDVLMDLAIRQLIKLYRTKVSESAGRSNI